MCLLRLNFNDEEDRLSDTLYNLVIFRPLQMQIKVAPEITGLNQKRITCTPIEDE